LAVEGRQGNSLDRPLAEVLEQVASHHRPLRGRLGGDEPRAPALHVAAGGVADVPVLLVVQLEHDAATAVCLPGEADVAILAWFRLLHDAILPAGNGPLEALHGDDPDALLAGENDSLLDLPVAWTARQLPEERRRVIFQHLGDSGRPRRLCCETRSRKDRKERTDKREHGSKLHPGL